MQWADAVKVMSRGTPRSRTSVTWGIWWPVSAAENDGESGGRFPTVRHAHLLGLIGRSHFSAHPEPVYEGTPTDYCKDQAVFDERAVPFLSVW